MTLLDFNEYIKFSISQSDSPFTSRKYIMHRSISDSQLQCYHKYKVFSDGT